MERPREADYALLPSSVVSTRTDSVIKSMTWATRVAYPKVKAMPELGLGISRSRGSHVLSFKLLSLNSGVYRHKRNKQ